MSCGIAYSSWWARSANYRSNSSEKRRVDFNKDGFDGSVECSGEYIKFTISSKTPVFAEKLLASWPSSENQVLFGAQ